MTTKVCAKCGEAKTLDGFHKASNRPDGRYPYCKPCKLADEKLRRDPVAERVRVRSWRENNPDRNREIQANYYWTHHADVLERQRAGYHRRGPKNQANAAVRRAIDAGKIQRQPCEACGDPQTDAHHPDYDRPLDVRWLCRRHHAEAHRKDSE
jgi:hypothetical protein